MCEGLKTKISDFTNLCCLCNLENPKSDMKKVCYRITRQKGKWNRDTSFHYWVGTKQKQSTIE